MEAGSVYIIRGRAGTEKTAVVDRDTAGSLSTERWQWTVNYADHGRSCGTRWNVKYKVYGSIIEQLKGEKRRDKRY